MRSLKMLKIMDFKITSPKNVWFRLMKYYVAVFNSVIVTILISSLIYSLKIIFSASSNREIICGIVVSVLIVLCMFMGIQIIPLMGIYTVDYNLMKIHGVIGLLFLIVGF